MKSIIKVCAALLFFISCSKGNNNSLPIQNIFSYTVTDSSGNKYTFNDTSSLGKSGKYSVQGYNYTTMFPVATILKPNSTDNPSPFFQFIFYDYRGNSTTGANHITFYLPIVDFTAKNAQVTISPYGAGPVDLFFDTTVSIATEYTRAYQTTTAENVWLETIDITTNISDNSGGYVSGSFQINSTILTGKSIIINGTFSHALLTD